MLTYVFSRMLAVKIYFPDKQTHINCIKTHKTYLKNMFINEDMRTY